MPLYQRQKHEPLKTRQVRLLDSLGAKSWTDCLHLTADIKIYRTRWHFFQSSTAGVRWTCAHCSFRFLWLADSIGTPIKSAVVAHPPEGLTCCAFCYAFLLIVVLMRSCLDYCSFLVSLNQSEDFLMNSLITKAFLSTKLLLTGGFFVAFCVNCCLWQTQESFFNYSNQPI